jgi:hypothetical protein
MKKTCLNCRHFEFYLEIIQCNDKSETIYNDMFLCGIGMWELYSDATAEQLRDKFKSAEKCKYYKILEK